MIGHYIFVVNDLSVRGKRLDAQSIVSLLLKHSFWAFSPYTPGKGRLKEGDRALIYMAGNRRRHFVARCMVMEEPSEASGEQREVLDSLGLNFMIHCVPLARIEIFSQPVAIRPLVNQLRFIGNKKFFGHYLRHGVVTIPAEDYKLICHAAAGIQMDVRSP